jgi:hypothetical protein
VRGTMVQMVAWMRKDLYALRWLAVTVAVLTSVSSFAAHPELFAGDSRRFPNSILGQAGGLLVGVMFLGWWALTERLMHTDPVAGDREPWFTLPVSRRVLTSSKLVLLFLLLFVPHIAGDVALAAYVHADFVPIIASVVPRVVFFFAVIVLPAVVLSALTRNLSQFFVAIIASVLILYGAVVLIAGISPNPQLLRVSGDAPWIPEWTLVLVGLFIGVGMTFWLYSSRRTTAGRFASAAILAISLLGAPWISPPAQWRWHRYWQGEAALDKQIGLSFNEAILLPSSDADSNTLEGRRVRVSTGHVLPVPLVVSGVSDEIFVVPRGGNFVITTINGQKYLAGEISNFIGLDGTYGRPSPTRTVVPLLPQVTKLPDRVGIEVNIRAEVFHGHSHLIKSVKGWNRLGILGTCWQPRFDGFSFCASAGPRFPFGLIEAADGRDQNAFGTLDDETAPIPIPSWSPVEIRSFPTENVGPHGSQLRYWTWNYSAPVEVKVVIQNYHVADYSFFGSTLQVP